MSAATDASNLKFVIQLVLGVACQNNFLDQNWWESGLGEHPKNFGTPFLFLQQLKLWTSNLVYKLGLWSSDAKNDF